MNDYILNGAANGNVASVLMANNFNVHSLRPFIGNDGRTYVTRQVGNKLKSVPIRNASATLRYEDWKLLDDAIVKAAKPRLKAVADLRAAGLTFTIPNGMGTTVLQTENMSDINDASISMDGLRDNANDRPQFDLVNLPLPIIHKDFSFSSRQIQTSRNGGSPLDTSMAELAGRKVAEQAEKLLTGTASSYAYGGGTIYGYTNYTNRLAKTVTDPSSSGWTGSTFLEEILDMRQSLVDNYYYGPWMIYNAPVWDQYLDEDFKTNSDITVRERIKKVEGIQDIRTLDYLDDSTHDIVMVQMTSDVVREVIGMDITTVQWQSNGGLQQNFKVMAIMVPQLRADNSDNCGIMHGAS